MSPHPTGIVTFLFTDIVGSTRLARKYPDTWDRIQARHDDLLKAVIEAHEGYVFRTVGDEFNAAFATVCGAVEAAADAQRALQAEDWGEIGSIQVRMGLHTGQAAPREGDYEGYLTLSHVKRLMTAAHGGQILISEAAGISLQESMPKGISLIDLGKHRLKDFERAEHIYQAVGEGILADFPPLKSLDVIPNNLPAQLTSFIGREKELREVQDLLSRERLVTLTGPGGSGKTRLALQTASLMLERFPDGVFVTALEPVTDPGLVAASIAQTLGIRETGGQSIAEGLKDYIRGKDIMLLLDNFEQVIAAAPFAAELLEACSQLKVLVTSREGLRISGEHEYPVPPLALPEDRKYQSVEAFTRSPAVELFLQRAQAVKPDFNLTEETAEAVVEICYRLDGLPLAIELAAARIKTMTPQAMLARLENVLEFLTGGRRDLPPRQQTLRSTIAWSYDLLDEYEQRLFRRLAVFIGGFTADAASAIDQDSRNHLADNLSSLMDKSLVVETRGMDGEPRYTILEVLREFGLEQLKASGEEETVRQRHTDYFLALAEEAERSAGTPEQVQWINRLEEEHGNLRSALDWCRTAEGREETCLRLAGTLGYFWEARGYYSEGREKLAAVLSLGTVRKGTASRAKILTRAAELAYRQSDYLATIEHAGKSLGIYRKLGDKQGTASALLKLGNAAAEVGDFAAAGKYYEEALSIWRKLEDKQGTSRALVSLGWTALRSGDYQLAQRRLEEAFTLSRELEDTRYMGFELAGLGEVALRQGDTRRAVELVEESLELRRQLGNKWGVGVCLGILGWAAIREGDWEQAVDRLGESLEVRREIGDKSGTAWCLERLAEVAVSLSQPEKGVRLLGAAAGLRASVGSVIDPVDLPVMERMIEGLRGELGERRYAEAWEAGQRMVMERAVEYALEKVRLE